MSDSPVLADSTRDSFQADRATDRNSADFAPSAIGQPIDREPDQTADKSMDRLGAEIDQDVRS